ncbi:MAG TPA: hypothetical protein VJT54_06850 [Verrucomicrobiae bacterium]|nr:hypothetical protein [Verrucomicrobiae bacterium]
MVKLTENEIGPKCFAPCFHGLLLLKPLAEKVKRVVAQNVLFFSRRLEKQLVLSNLQHSGFKRNKMNRNDLKRREVFERKASWRETQQPILITKGRNQRQIHE